MKNKLISQKKETESVCVSGFVNKNETENERGGIGIKQAGDKGKFDIKPSHRNRAWNIECD